MEYKSANSLVNKKLLKQKSTLLQEYRKKLQTIYKSGDYTTNEASVCLPFDKKHIHQIKFLTKKYSFAKNIILIGIGGSNLGCKAIYETFKESQN